MSIPKGFQRFIGIDWSGAAGLGQRGIAVAVADPAGMIDLLAPPGGGLWSRPAVLDLLRAATTGPRTLAGIDTSFALPFDDLGAYLPGQDWPDAPSLWQAVEQAAAADAVTLSGAGFARAQARFFHRPGARGAETAYRVRRTEAACLAQYGARAETAFKLIGPSQVGLAALATMRLLHRLWQSGKGVAIWPMAPAASAATEPLVLVELFASIFAAQYGHRGKVRDRATLDRLLAQYGARFCGAGPPLTDHAADAVLMAAGLYSLQGRQKAWQPAGLCPKLAPTEGWIFGVT